MRVVLHPEVFATITVNVARTAEEAELQASGKSIQELAAEEEAAADFEIAELFDDIGSAASDDDDLAPVAEAVGAASDEDDAAKA
jgi:large subunit ribosomal protein L9